MIQIAQEKLISISFRFKPHAFNHYAVFPELTESKDSVIVFYSFFIGYRFAFQA